jgi:hypothetical protein
MARKIIRLTESDLTRLVKRVIRETNSDMPRRSMDEQPEDIDSEDYSSYGEKTFQKITNASKREVDRFLENLPENTKFIQISDCEYADFSSIDICSFPKLVFMNLKGTENNFEEQNYDCPFSNFGNGVYDFTPDY